MTHRSSVLLWAALGMGLCVAAPGAFAVAHFIRTYFPDGVFQPDASCISASQWPLSVGTVLLVVSLGALPVGAWGGAALGWLDLPGRAGAATSPAARWGLGLCAGVAMVVAGALWGAVAAATGIAALLPVLVGIGWESGWTDLLPLALGLGASVGGPAVGLFSLGRVVLTRGPAALVPVAGSLGVAATLAGLIPIG